LFVAAVVVVLSVAELTSRRFKDFTAGHSLISTFMTEAVLLVGVYLVLDEIIQRRETRRWSDVMSLGIRALSARAEGPAVIIRRTVDELVAETESEPSGSEVASADASGGGSVDYEEFVTGRADELADWLLADLARACSFAEETRRSASSLEEAIIRWGPTLVEDPDSAELINLLPDIVDAARSAADTITSASADREVFRDCLLDVLKNADEFRSRASRAHSYP
jgi:hypothetical protein